MVSYIRLDEIGRFRDRSPDTLETNFADYGTTARNDGLPTWVPRWDEGRHRQIIGYADIFKASLQSSPAVSFPKTHLLQVNGVVADYVKTTSQILPNDRFDGLDDHKFASAIWKQQCGFERFDTKAKYINGSPALWVFLDVLSASLIEFDLDWARRPLEDKIPHLASYLTKVHDDRGVNPIVANLGETGDYTRFLESAQIMTWNRSFITTGKGYYALGPDFVEDGDILCVLFGSETPFFLRPHGNCYLLVGECYAHGFMLGEAMEMLNSCSLQQTSFDIL